MKKQKLAIIVLGKPNSGKSQTWYEIFSRRIRSGWKKLKLGKTKAEIYEKNSSFEEMKQKINIDIFVRNASFEEYGDNVEDYFKGKKIPDIVFCSVQYIEKGIKTIDWFREQGYYLYIQWLNPGYKHKYASDDELKFKEKFESFGEFHERTGKEIKKRTNEIKNFLINWIT